MHVQIITQSSPTQKEVVSAYLVLLLEHNTPWFCHVQKKPKVLHQPPPDSSATLPNITIDSVSLVNVDLFPYLGSHLSLRADSEIHHCICCASGAFTKLCRRVFENSDLPAKTELLVYKAVILPTLLYGAETCMKVLLEQNN